MAEKLNTSELRRAMNISNMQVTGFFESYIRNIKTCVERTDLEINLPEHNQASTSDFNQNVIALQSRRGQQPVDMELNNELNTILEETGDENLFNSINAIVSSTPCEQRGIVEQEESPLTTEMLQTFETVSSLASAETSHSKRSPLGSANRKRSSARPLNHRISEETSSEEEESPNKDVFVNKRRQNITIVSSDTDAIDEFQESDEDFLDYSRVQSKFPLKEAVLNVTKLDISASTTKRFKKAFHDTETEEDEENRALKEGSVDSNYSSISAVTSNTCSSSMTASKASKAPRKKKAPVVVPPRTNVRPIRKARPQNIREVSLKGKLRRPE